MQSRQFPATSEPHEGDPTAVSSSMLTGAGLALMCTGIAGGMALLLSAISPYLAGGYVALALAAGVALELFGRRRTI